MIVELLKRKVLPTYRQKGECPLFPYVRKNLVKGNIRELCEQAGASDPKGLAKELALLLEGATVTVQVSQSPKTAQIAKRAAKALIDNAIPRKRCPIHLQTAISICT
ncbi:hypothetical protein [Candidatus Nitrospira salsa]